VTDRQTDRITTSKTALA